MTFSRLGKWKPMPSMTLTMTGGLSLTDLFTARHTSGKGLGRGYAWSETMDSLRYCNRCGKPREQTECLCTCGCPEYSLEINVTYQGWVNRQAKDEQGELF
jgi:NADH pyrophosphatase NudC (nudix superfamily)